MAVLSHDNIFTVEQKGEQDRKRDKQLREGEWNNFQIESKHTLLFLQLLLSPLLLVSAGGECLEPIQGHILYDFNDVVCQR